MAQKEVIREHLGFKPHFVRQGDGKGGWITRPARYRILGGTSEGYFMPYGVAQMDNGEILLMAGMQDQGEYGCVVALSTDNGNSWSEPIRTGAYGRPLTFGSLGNGHLVFGNELLGKPEDDQKKLRLYFSNDYGRTWEGRPYPMITGEGSASWTTEGTLFSEVDPESGRTRIGHFSVSLDPLGWDRAPSRLYLRWSEDFGKSWRDESSPAAWVVNNAERSAGVSEGSLVRAKNGWLVAGLRTDLPVRYREVPHDDSLEGIGVSISKDDGKTWSPVEVLYDAGRHHPSLIVMPDGDIVMTLIVRADVQGGKLASYCRGCEALVSRDHGLTWDLGQKIILDEYEFFDNKKWYNGECGHSCSTLLDDGSLLTVYGNYLARSAAVINWRLDT
ncbi:MAG: exo-alpha-sialidase [Candidatus Latescibacteria bacterium]|nr:exo-alpha-sialidase [Candidatus Latescibacterota bacterium]